MYYVWNEFFWGKERVYRVWERYYDRVAFFQISYKKWTTYWDNQPLACFIHKMKCAKCNHFIVIDVFSVLSMNLDTEDTPMSRQKRPCLAEPRFEREGQSICKWTKETRQFLSAGSQASGSPAGAHCPPQSHMPCTSTSPDRVYHSDFQPFYLMAHVTSLLSKILQHTKKYAFCQSDKKLGIILIHSHQMAIAVLAVVIFYLTV